MKVILTSDVRNLGKLGDVVNVKSGYARNYLLPKGVARVATERRMKELNHLLNVAKAKKAQIFATRKELLDKVTDVKLTLKARCSHESDKLFGSITNIDISNALYEKGFEVDKRDIILKSNIKTLGNHSVKINMGENLTGEIIVVVEKEIDTTHKASDTQNKEPETVEKKSTTEEQLKEETIKDQDTDKEG